METILYAFLAVLGLGFLVFIHELGHYWVARREGMKIEAFSIGFGRPLFTWERDGVKWMICLLPFGGYVRIAGMQREGSREPYEITDGFYAKRPWARIKVALAGPLVNIVFAIGALFFIWIAGGRTKQFAEFTGRIGWVDPQSALYELGVRPGDVIDRYDNHAFHGFKDLLVASLMKDKTMRIEGHKIDYTSGKRSNFDYTLNTYENPQIAKEKLFTIGVFSPASYLIYDGGELFQGSPIANSGIQPGDRILWADGEMVFSIQQLSFLTNESTALLTVQRDGKIFQTKVPRVQLDDLKMKPFEKAEVGDWQYEAAIKGKLQELYFIPFNLSPDCIVESKVDFLDPQEEGLYFQKCQRCTYNTPIVEGDKILAVDGKPVHFSYQLLQELQTRHVVLIVERNPSAIEKILWTKADSQFDQFEPQALLAMIGSIGTDHLIKDQGDLHLLNPVVPTTKSELMFTNEQKVAQDNELASVKKEIQKIGDASKRNEALKTLELGQKRLILGVPLKDREVIYNPNPIKQFGFVLADTWRTLSGLFSGMLNPKYMSGPVGIVHVVHQSWMVGFKEAIFWMAVISLNLGIVNLLPIPVLDGGHIVFSCVEIVRKKPLRSKTMERLIFPFIGLLIAFFIYITYQDIARLFSKFL